MEETLQQKEITHCIGLSPTSTWRHHIHGSEANNALTINLHKSDKAAHSKGLFESHTEIIISEFLESVIEAIEPVMQLHKLDGNAEFFYCNEVPRNN